MSDFDTTYREYLAAKKRAATAAGKVTELSSRLEILRRNLMLSCVCGMATRIGDIELIREEFNGRTDYNDDWNCDVRQFWVCSNCTETNVAPIPDQVHFHDPVGRYFKIVHTWDSDRERCHGRVLELLGPSLKRADERRRKEEQAARLESARRTLREAGEL